MKINGDDEYRTGTEPPNTTKHRASTPVAARASISWNERSNALAPILGDSGVTAIYRRALECAEIEYPCLDEIREQTLKSNSFAPLVARLCLCTPDSAAALQDRVLEQFDQQLTVLFGEPLAQRLLGMVGATVGRAPPAPSLDQIAEQLTLTALRAAADARLARCERDEAIRASEQDGLTGTASRSRMLDRLQSAITLADRTGTPTAVLFIDLNRFKQINDGMGHRAGDDMLREVGARLQEAVRKTDTVCRYGGDEFVVILTPMERKSEAGPAAARMLLAIEKARGPDPAVPMLSASIGIGLYPEHGTTPDALLSRADRAMYRNKRDQCDPLPDAQEDRPCAAPDLPSGPGIEIPRVIGPPAGLTLKE